MSEVWSQHRVTRRIQEALRNVGVEQRVIDSLRDNARLVKLKIIESKLKESEDD